MVTRKRKDGTKATKVVWRISAAAPLGEYVRTKVDGTAAPLVELRPRPKSEGPPLPEGPESGWYRSSHDLVHGMEVSETPLDALPGASLDPPSKKKSP